MTEIVIIRHGETALNTRGVFRGREDVPLNERGERQATALAEALSEEPLSAVFSSPLARALDTARAVAAMHDLTPKIDEAFNNIDLGEWQAREKEEVRREEPEQWRLWTHDPDSLRIPGGEALAQVRERSYRRTLELVREYEGRRVAVVSHRSVAKLLSGALLGLTSGYFWKFYLDNAAYSVFGFDEDRVVLLKWNESCHLEDRTVEQF
jgi:broad specificity phosphatase PhoE